MIHVAIAGKNATVEPDKFLWFQYHGSDSFVVDSDAILFNNFDKFNRQRKRSIVLIGDGQDIAGGGDSIMRPHKNLFGILKGNIEQDAQGKLHVRNLLEHGAMPITKVREIIWKGRIPPSLAPNAKHFLVTAIYVANNRACTFVIDIDKFGDTINKLLESRALVLKNMKGFLSSSLHSSLHSNKGKVYSYRINAPGKVLGKGIEESVKNVSLYLNFNKDDVLSIQETGQNLLTDADGKRFRVNSYTVTNRTTKRSITTLSEWFDEFYINSMLNATPLEDAPSTIDKLEEPSIVPDGLSLIQPTVEDQLIQVEQKVQEQPETVQVTDIVEPDANTSIPELPEDDSLDPVSPVTVTHIDEPDGSQEVTNVTGTRRLLDGDLDLFSFKKPTSRNVKINSIISTPEDEIEDGDEPKTLPEATEQEETLSERYIKVAVKRTNPTLQSMILSEYHTYCARNNTREIPKSVFYEIASRQANLYKQKQGLVADITVENVAQALRSSLAEVSEEKTSLRVVPNKPNREAAKEDVVLDQRRFRVAGLRLRAKIQNLLGTHANLDEIVNTIKNDIEENDVLKPFMLQILDKFYSVAKETDPELVKSNPLDLLAKVEKQLGEKYKQPKTSQKDSAEDRLKAIRKGVQDRQEEQLRLEQQEAAQKEQQEAAQREQQEAAQREQQEAAQREQQEAAQFEKEKREKEQQEIAELERQRAERELSLKRRREAIEKQKQEEAELERQRAERELSLKRRREAIEKQEQEQQELEKLERKAADRKLAIQQQKEAAQRAKAEQEQKEAAQRAKAEQEQEAAQREKLEKEQQETAELEQQRAERELSLKRRREAIEEENSEKRTGQRARININTGKVNDTDDRNLNRNMPEPYGTAVKNVLDDGAEEVLDGGAEEVLDGDDDLRVKNKTEQQAEPQTRPKARRQISDDIASLMDIIDSAGEDKPEI